MNDKINNYIFTYKVTAEVWHKNLFGKVRRKQKVIQLPLNIGGSNLVSAKKKADMLADKSIPKLFQVLKSSVISFDKEIQSIVWIKDDGTKVKVF